MNTFQFNLNQTKTLQYDKIKSFVTKRSQGHKSLSLTQKGLNQAHRNDSTDMWKLIHGWEGQTQPDSYINHSQRPYDFVNQNEEKSFKRSQKRSGQIQNISQNEDKQKNIVSMERSFSVERISNQRPKQTSKKAQKQEQLSSKNQASKEKTKKGHTKLKEPQVQQKQPKYEYLQKMNSGIKKYLQQQKFASRTLSNSAFAKLYNKPCVQSYGFGNISKQSQLTNNILKTHNITPHTSQNHPEYYQSYKTALLYSKRSRIDQQDKQQRIRRQFLSYFDDFVVQTAKSQLKQKNKERKARSEEKIRKRFEQLEKKRQEENEQQMKQKKETRKSLKESLGKNEPVFVYRHSNEKGYIRISTDRHGLSCYVDPEYRGNDAALRQFKKMQMPILPQKIQQQDLNLDKIRKENFQKSQEQLDSRHYLMPCVEAPYDKKKYQLKKKKAESTVK